jgi:hypothetical protein
MISVNYTYPYFTQMLNWALQHMSQKLLTLKEIGTWQSTDIILIHNF